MKIVHRIKSFCSIFEIFGQGVFHVLNPFLLYRGLKYALFTKQLRFKYQEILIFNLLFSGLFPLILHIISTQCSNPDAKILIEGFTYYFWTVPFCFVSLCLNFVLLKDFQSVILDSHFNKNLKSTLFIAETVYFTIFLLVLLFLTHIVLLIPLFGWYLSLFLRSIFYDMCLLDTILYRIYSFSQKITFLEDRWIFYLGYGLPLAVLHSLTNNHFSFIPIIFPVILISTNMQMKSHISKQSPTKLKMLFPIKKLTDYIVIKILMLFY